MAANAYRNWSRASASAKRGGGVPSTRLDLPDENRWQPEAPDDGASLRFDRHWAESVLDAAWQSIVSASTTTPEKAARVCVLYGPF